MDGTEDDILFDPNIVSDDEMSDSFPSDSESNADNILFDCNVGSKVEMSDSFPSNSESNEDEHYL